MELVAVLLIVAILALAVGGRMVSRQSLAPDLRKAQLGSVLSWAQLAAMQNTADSIALAVHADCVALASLASGNADCPGATLGGSDALLDHPATLVGDGVTFALSGSQAPGLIRFDGLGRPSCTGTCQVRLQGADASQALCINSEGWIHDC
ncbi:hypothetical protein [Gallaecimonas sp. GXIMD4217]|uniref:hypothetical protein n=1 Tax=Gallaecimonas sp. GXIMD4217 TaxID=3131927 RepID=UPI00311B3A67